MRDGVNYDSDDHKIYAPDKVDKFEIDTSRVVPANPNAGTQKFVRLDEYKKAYEFIERIINQRQSS